MAGIYDHLRRVREATGQGGSTVSGPDDYSQWADVVSGYNRTRVPDMPELEQASSDRIRELLNPPQMFTDVSRMAAEGGAMRGIGGSPAAGSLHVRMTDDERLRRMALGQEMLSGAAQRYPAANPAQPESFFMTPYQDASLRLGWSELQAERDKLAAEIKANRGRSGVTSLGMPDLGAATEGRDWGSGNPGYSYAPTPGDMARYITPNYSQYFNQ